MRTWADNFNTYQEACDFYGCDGPKQLAAEAAWFDSEAAIENQDWMEIHGRPLPDFRAQLSDVKF